MAPVSDALIKLVARSLRSAKSVASSLPELARRSGASISPVQMHDLDKRASPAPQFPVGEGAKPAASYNNQVFLALFAIIGAGMVLTSIWFFFWAKNGGFKWRENDWDDYKSTVLRRKGPDGRTLSNASKSTRLGGGSVVHGGSYGHSEIGSTVYTESSGFTDKDEMRDVEAGMGIRGGDGHHHAKSKRSKDPELQQYRHEKPARVGGMNRQHDGSHFDKSTTGSETATNVTSNTDNKKRAKKEQERREKERRRQEKEALKSAAAEAKSNAKKEKEKDKADKKLLKSEKYKDDASTTISVNEPTTDNRPLAIDNKPHRVPSTSAYSFTTGDDNVTESAASEYNPPARAVRSVPSTIQEVSESVVSGASENRSHTSSNKDSYYSSYRPKAENSPARESRRSANSSPTKSDRDRTDRERSDRERRRRRAATESSRRHHQQQGYRQSVPPSSVGSSDIFSQNGANDSGHRSYPCYIPGVSSAGSIAPGESISQVGAPGRRGRDVMDGYRRGGAAGRSRRDSLSDSDSEAV